jgi:hypothetical protein
MVDNQDDLTSVVVLEAGAAWPPWLNEYQRLAPNAVVIAQADSEASERFRDRVLHRLREARQAGARVRAGVLVAGHASEPSAHASRTAIAGAVLDALGANQGDEGELVLGGDGLEGDSARQQLFELAGALCEHAAGASINVRVRFTHARSGVMRSVQSATAERDKSKSSGA